MNSAQNEAKLAATLTFFDKRKALAGELSIALSRSKCKTLSNFLQKNQCNLNLAFDNGDYPIHVAARKQDQKLAIEMVKLLVKHGANVNAQNTVTRTALGIAADNGNVGLVNYLLDQEAEYWQDTASNPYTIALLHGHVNIIETLVKKGAPVSEKELTQATNAVNFFKKTSDDVAYNNAKRSEMLIKRALQKHLTQKQNKKYIKLR
jgi:ankyrin repeat protein